MHRAASFGWAGLVFFAVLLPHFIWAHEIQYVTNDIFNLKTNFNGIDDPPGYASPDATIAAGPMTLVIARNSTVAIRDKSGILIDVKTMGEFFASIRTPGANALTDPHVLFDQESHHFFLVNSDRMNNPNCAPGTCVADILLAVSKTTTPMTLDPTDWYFYVLDRTVDKTSAGTTVTTNWGDFDHLTVVDDTLAISMDLYRFVDNSPQGGKVRLLKKSELIGGGPILTWIDFVGFQNATLAAITFGSPGVLFLIAQGPCAVQVWGISNPFTSPTLTSHTMPVGELCQSALAAAQPGGAAPLDMVPKVQPVYRNDSIWTVMPVGKSFGTGEVSVIRWAQIDVHAWPGTPSLIQGGILGTEGVWHFAPAIIVDAADNFAMVYARSSTTEFASSYYTGRLATDPPNTLRPGNLLKPGIVTFNNVIDGRNRFTDYFGIALDPIDNSFWLMGMYPKAPTTSGTWVGNVIAPAGIEAVFESPETGSVSGVAVIRGWAFATEPGVSISKVELFINGVSAGDIPCCSQRADVQAAFPDNPNALNSGWATTFNWGVLDVGSYTVQVVIKNTLGQTLSAETRMVTVVKPGNFEFLDLFSLAQATALIDGEELVLEGITVRDKATQQQKTIDAHYRWSSSSQSFGLIQSPTLAQSSPAPSLFAAWWSALLTGLKGLTTPTQASPGVIAAFESPEANQLAAGVGVVRGWAFSDTASATITEVRLIIDGTVAGTVPCCSARADVAAAYPGIATALNSGWGAVFNYGILNAGPHTFGVQITDSTGATFSAPHGVTVVKLGGFEFLDQCTLSGATAQIQGEDVVLSGVQVRDKATQQSKIITLRVRWLQSAQAFGIVASQG